MTLLLVMLPLIAGISAATEVDAVNSSPDKFKVLLDNEHVRVVEYSLLPGERDDWHTHPPKVSYVKKKKKKKKKKNVAGGKLRITTENGESFLADEQSGTAAWMGSLGSHFAENIGPTPVRILLVEVKAAARVAANSQ